LPVGGDDGVLQQLLLGLGLLRDFGDRRAVLSLLQFATHDVSCMPVFVVVSCMSLLSVEKDVQQYSKDAEKSDQSLPYLISLRVLSLHRYMYVLRRSTANNYM
jgi:hypothetical protein